MLTFKNNSMLKKTQRMRHHDIRGGISLVIVEVIVSVMVAVMVCMNRQAML